MARYVHVLREQQALRWRQSGCRGWLEVWESRGEIEEKRRGVFDQPTAHSARKELELEVAALSKLESACQRQHKAAVDACVVLAESMVKEQKTRVQQGSVEGALETSTEAGAHNAGCGGDVATLLSLLAAIPATIPSHNRSCAHRAFLTSQMRSPPPLSRPRSLGASRKKETQGVT